MGGALKTPMGLAEVSPEITGLTDSARQKIHQLGDLIIRQPIDHNRGSIEGGGFGTVGLRLSTNAENSNMNSENMKSIGGICTST